MDLIWLLVSKNMQTKFPKCAQKEWSVFAKINKWQDVTALSWYHLQLEIKQHKAMLAHLKASKICDLVYRQKLHHCTEELCPGEEGGRWMVILSGKLPETSSQLNSPGAKVHQVTQSRIPPTRSLQDHQ